MAWQDAKQKGEEWAEKNLPADLRGQILQMVIFESDKDALFFYADRTQEFQAMVIQSIARQVRKRKGKTIKVIVTPAQYWEWLTGQSQEDSDTTRLAFIESLMHLGNA